MKRVLSLILALISTFTILGLTACDEETPVQKVNVKYMAPNAVMTALQQGEIDAGVLPEPAASRLIRMSSDKTWTRLSLQEAYNSQDKAFPQAVIMVKSGLLSALSGIVNSIKTSIDGAKIWAIDNPTQALEVINANFVNGSTTLTVPDLNTQTINNCGIYWQDATDAKSEVTKYINEVKSVSGKFEASARVVDDEFFYDGTSYGAFNKDTIKICVPDGAPALAFAWHMYKSQTMDVFGCNRKVDFDVVSAGEVDAIMVNNTADIIILPLNTATLYYDSDSSDPYKMVSVLTHGNLYIMSSQPINSVKDLLNKTVGCIEKNKVPGFTFRIVLKKNGLTGVEVNK